MTENNTVTASSSPVARGKRAGFGLIAAYVLAYFGIWIAALTPVVVTLPIRVRQVDPQNYVGNLSLILAFGALLAMFANPFFGRLSDRTTSRFGMRRPWLLIGALLTIAGVLAMALVPSIPVIGLGWCLTQVAVNILLAVTTAILPDQIPPQQRGMVSGYLSMCMSVAPTVGAFVAEIFVSSPLWTFLVPALFVAVSCLLLALVLKDRHMDKKDVTPYSLRDFFGTFWVNWVKYPDFTWIWLSRFLRFVSLALLLSYEVYFVTDHLGKSTTEVSGIMVFATLATAVMGMVGANAAGLLSDVVKRRKIFVIVGALIYACSMALLAMTTTLPLFYIAVGLSGLGQGVFVAADFAVVTEVLPEVETNAAKNLGVFNIANALPQSIAPAFAPFILAIGGGHGNYFALFMVAAAASFVAALLVPLIRKVR
jgi:MFS family permease